MEIDYEYLEMSRFQLSWQPVHFYVRNILHDQKLPPAFLL